MICLKKRLFLLPKPIMDFVLSSECMGFLFARCRVISVVPQNHVSHIFRDSIVLCSITSTMQGRECDTNNVRMYADMVSSIYTIESRYITNFISHSVCDAANSIRILECALICAHFSRCNCKRNSMNWIDFYWESIRLSINLPSVCFYDRCRIVQLQLADII